MTSARRADGVITGRVLWRPVIAVTAAIAALVAGSVLLFDPAPPPQPDTPPMATVAAEDFLSSVGINVHMSYYDTGYRDAAAVVKAVEGLCIRHVRDNLAARPTPQLPSTYRAFRDAGVDVTVVVGSPGAKDTLPSPARSVSWIREHDLAPSPVTAIEGPNEWDQRGGEDWAQDVIHYQQGLADELAAKGLTGVALVAPSTARTDRRAALGDLSTMADAASNHDYPDGGPPDVPTRQQLQDAAGLVGDKPIWVTETGYQTSGERQNGQLSVTPHQQAIYLPRLLAGSYLAGAERTYIYELLDFPPDRPKGLNFGVMSDNFEPKPAYHALSRLLCGISDTTGGKSPEPEVRIRSASGSVHTLALAHSNGSVTVLAWTNGVVPPRSHEASPQSTTALRIASDRDVDVRTANVSTADSASLRPVDAGHDIDIEVGEGLVVTTLTSRG